MYVITGNMVTLTGAICRINMIGLEPGTGFAQTRLVTIQDRSTAVDWLLDCLTAACFVFLIFTTAVHAWMDFLIFITMQNNKKIKLFLGQIYPDHQKTGGIPLLLLRMQWIPLMDCLIGYILNDWRANKNAFIYFLLLRGWKFSNCFCILNFYSNLPRFDCRIGILFKNPL